MLRDDSGPRARHADRQLSTSSHPLGWPTAIGSLATCKAIGDLVLQVYHFTITFSQLHEDFGLFTRHMSDMAAISCRLLLQLLHHWTSTGGPVPRPRHDQPCPRTENDQVTETSTFAHAVNARIRVSTSKSELSTRACQPSGYPFANHSSGGINYLLC